MGTVYRRSAHGFQTTQRKGKNMKYDRITDPQKDQGTRKGGMA